MNKFLQISLLLLLVSFSVLLKAQVPTVSPLVTDSFSVKKDSSESSDRQVDLIDIVQSVLHKPQERKERTFEYEKGKTFISVIPAVGYTLQTGFAGLISGNVAFYTDSHKEQKLSSILSSVTYTQYKQFIVPFQANLWTKGNTQNFVIDWRYMHYPSFTYGLNGGTSLQDKYTVDYYYAKVHQSVFKNIGNNLYAGIGYYFDYFWNIKEINIAPNDNTLFQRYGLNSTEISSGPAFRFLYDSRLNQVNPTNGFYSNIVYRPNFTFLGSLSNWQSILLEFRKYVQLPQSKNVLAFWSYNWLTAGGKPPYLLLPSTGWDDSFNTGRGYIQGRFRGRNMIYLEAEYRFDITRNGLFGGVLFSNAQLFTSETSFAFKSLSPAVGTGLRIKLNRFSGANLCIDYGIGMNGSRGFFVNLNEVF